MMKLAVKKAEPVDAEAIFPDEGGTHAGKRGPAAAAAIRVINSSLRATFRVLMPDRPNSFIQLLFSNCLTEVF